MRLAPAPEVLPAALAISPELLALRPRALLRALMRQPLSVWSLYSYLFFEYVRPQTIYPWFDFLPWAQISLLVAVATALATEMGKRRWTLIDSGMVIYTVLVLASILWAFDTAKSWNELDIYVAWVLVYVALSSTVNTQTRVVLMLVGWFIWNLKMSLHGFRTWASIGFAFQDWGVTGAPGWFQNSGEFGIQMCVVLPISLYFALGVRRHVSRPVFMLLLVLPITAFTGAIASSSRGALLGMTAIGLWMLLRTRHKVRGVLVLVAVFGLGYAFVPAEQKARISSSGDDPTSINRLTYWKRGIDFANENPILGIGYGNWIPYYTFVWGNRLEGRERIQLPHNYAIEALAELGYSGFFALVFLLGGTFWLNARTRALARQLGERGYLAEQLGWGFDGANIGFMVSGFFVSVLYYPYLWVNLAMTVSLHLTLTRAARTARAVVLINTRPVASN